MNTTALRPYELADNLRATSGMVWLTGTQALVRLLLMQRQRDQALGWRTAGFVSGYRGSPLGMVDQQLWKAGPLLEAAGVQFLPAINDVQPARACHGATLHRVSGNAAATLPDRLTSVTPRTENHCQRCPKSEG